MNAIHRHFVTGFERALAARNGGERRIGAELKLPLVNVDGTAASYQTVTALWDYLAAQGWQPMRDAVSGLVVGARKPGEQNDTVASCETGYCKTEFSLAHVADLFQLDRVIGALREELRPFCERHQVRFLGYGIQPVTPPSRRLLMKKSRSGVWDKVFASNNHIAPQDGDDVHLFTINAASHVHVSVSRDEAIPAVNLLNGFAGAQIALTAHSNIWRGKADTDHKCVAERFWDWWIPEANRVGVPERPFRDLDDYVATIASFRPVFVKRDGKPLLLSRYRTFSDYFASEEAIALDLEGGEVSVAPEAADIDLHSTCYWYSARLSHYYTVENRVNDQQPPDEMVCVPALTLGLLSALNEGLEAVEGYDWQTLRASREAACGSALAAHVDGVAVADLVRSMLATARLGLQRRGLGEEVFLAPLERRLEERRSPADDAAELFREGRVEALVAARSL